MVRPFHPNFSSPLTPHRPAYGDGADFHCGAGHGRQAAGFAMAGGGAKAGDLRHSKVLVGGGGAVLIGMLDGMDMAAHAAERPDHPAKGDPARKDFWSVRKRDADVDLGHVAIDHAGFFGDADGQ